MRKSREAAWAIGMLVAIVLLTRALTRVAPPCPYTICGIRPGMTRAEVAKLPGMRIVGEGTTPTCFSGPVGEEVCVVFKDGRVDHVAGETLERGAERYAIQRHHLGRGYHEFLRRDGYLHVHDGETYHGRFYDVFLAAGWPGQFSLTAKPPELADDY